MKRVVVLLIVVLMLSGCTQNPRCPYIEYWETDYRYNSHNRHIKIRDGYVLDQGYSYDEVETDNGYDLVLHFVMEE